MKKTNILLPLVCSIPVLLGQTVSAYAQEPLRVEPVMSVKHSEPGLEVWYKMGRQHQENKRFDLASEAYRHVLDNDANNVDARNAMATIYSQQNRFDEAVAEFQSLLQSNPKTAYLYNNLGYTYLLKADYMKAIAAFGNALAIEPANARAFGNLALAYERLGNAAPAVATSEPAPVAQAEQPKVQEQSVPAVASSAPEMAVLADATEAGAGDQPEVVAQAVETTAPAEAPQPALKSIVMEIANGTRDTKLGAYMADALSKEGVKITRVTALKPYSQQRNVILYRDGYYKQALALSRSFTTPPALVNNTHKRSASDKSNVRLVLGKKALQATEVASSDATGSTF